MLEGILAVSRDDLFVDGLGKLRYLVLFFLHCVLQVVVLLPQVADVLIIDEGQRILKVAKPMVHLVGFRRGCLDGVYVFGMGLETILSMVIHGVAFEIA